MIAMYMIFVMLAVQTKTSEARDTFGWRMALFVTFCVLQCFLIKVNAILYIFGIWLDLSDLYCGDAITPEEVEWCDKFWLYAGFFDLAWKWALDIYFAFKLREYAFLKPNNVR